MKIESIPLYDQIPLGGATHLIDVSHEDLTETTADTAQNVTLSVVSGELFDVTAVRLVEAFEDSSDSDFDDTALQIGDEDSANRFLASTQLNENGTTVSFKEGALAGRGYAYNATKEIRINFGSMTAKKLSDLDKGRLVVFVRKVDLTAYGPYE